MLAAERRTRLAKQLFKEGGVRVGPAARLFGVSTETIRKDLIYLEEQGIAHKSHGGAVPVGELLERPTTVKSAENQQAKAEIAAAARGLIPDGAIILMDAGSTTYALAQLVAGLSGVTVFTNSVPILNLLGPTANKVFCFGGLLRGSSMALVGGWAIEELRSIHVDLAFLGTDGFDGLAGPSCASHEEAQFKTEAMRASAQTMILADHSKFRQAGLFQFCGWEDVAAIVADHRLTSDYLDEFGHRTRVIVAPAFGADG